jgi:hypothetical protein
MGADKMGGLVPLQMQMAGRQAALTDKRHYRLSEQKPKKQTVGAQGIKGRDGLV